MDKELKEILIKAKKQVFSNLTGENLTRLKGDGIDLRDIKDYEWGDDIRHINWNATAKSNQMKVNTFDEYKQLNISIFFLTSGSINFGSKRLKQDVMSEVMAYLLFSSFKNHDLCETIFYADEIKKEYKPSKKLPQIDEIVKFSFEYNSMGSLVDYEKLFKKINERYKRGRIIILIGDFLTLPNISLLHKRFQTYAIIVRDRLEEDLKFAGEVQLKDPISLQSEKFFINTTIQEKYKEYINSYDKELEKEFLQAKVAYKKIYTDDSVYLKLLELFR